MAANLFSKKIDISFYHKKSEVNYDSTNKHYQASFDYAAEKEIIEFIDSFIYSVLLPDEKFMDFGALPRDKNMTNLYFDILGDFNNAQWTDFNAWYYDKKTRLEENFKKIIINSIRQQKEQKIDDLEFFCWMALITLIAQMSEEYFLKRFDTLKIMKDTLAIRLATAFEVILSELLHDEEIKRVRSEKTGQDVKKIEPLINRYCIMYADTADMTHVENIIFSKDKSVFCDRTIFNKFSAVFEQTLDLSERLKPDDNARNILSNMENIKVILGGRRDRTFLLKSVRRDREFIQKLVIKYEKSNIRRVLKEIVAETGNGGLINFIKHDGMLEEIFEDGRTRNYFIKLLKGLGNKRSSELARYTAYAYGRVERSTKSFFGGLSPKEMEKILTAGIENFSYCLRLINNFNFIRSKYGKRSAYSDEMTGIKIIRQSVLKIGAAPENGGDIIECSAAAIDQMTRIENLFQEGNLFYIRAEGDIYPGSTNTARGKKLFMFADLRNSTETTMKLTKDTAGFLTPYLNTVYKTAINNGGTEIYFAGDGFAAHFSKVTDCLRTAFIIHREFVSLRREAEDKIKIKEKNVFKELVRAGIINTDMLAVNLDGIDRNLQTDEIRDFLDMIIADPTLKIEDALHRVANEYSMPRVEIGIGITEGELFFAVIGEEDNVRFNIVLSPSLTQAARLSGSAAEVKQYLEKLYGLKNIPRKAYSQNKKLFNQGIVITSEVFDALANEVEVNILETVQTELSYNIHYYFDTALDKYISMSKLEQSISLKGIEKDVEVFEVFTTATQMDAYVNNRVKKGKKQ
jgi:class 3 adenylate cyclase